MARNSQAQPTRRLLGTTSFAVARSVSVEVASASGIDGISFEIETSSNGPTGRERFDWQTMNIRVYHREDGKETWGYLGTKDKASPESYSIQDDHSFTLFDGQRLRIHFIDAADIKPFDLDITFSPTSNEWSGTWSHYGQNLHAVLKQPASNPRVESPRRAKRLRWRLGG